MSERRAAVYPGLPGVLRLLLLVNSSITCRTLNGHNIPTLYMCVWFALLEAQSHTHIILKPHTTHSDNVAVATGRLSSARLSLIRRRRSPLAIRWIRLH